MTEITKEHIMKWLDEYFDRDDIITVVANTLGGNMFLSNQLKALFTRDNDVLVEVAQEHTEDMSQSFNFLLELDVDILIDGIIQGISYQNKEDMLDELRYDMDIDQPREPEGPGCSQCNRAIRDSYDFCPRCGEHIERDGESK